jgi:hypothetical protein
VDSVDGFVADAIHDGRAWLSPDKREEMLAEGRQIMLRLAQQYTPGKGGRDVNGSRFSGFAAKYLRLKLSDAYGRVCERDEQDRDPSQRPPVSLDALEDAPVAAEAIYDGYSDGVEGQIEHWADL